MTKKKQKPARSEKETSVGSQDVSATSIGVEMPQTTEFRDESRGSSGNRPLLSVEPLETQQQHFIVKETFEVKDAFAVGLPDMPPDAASSPSQSGPSSKQFNPLSRVPAQSAAPNSGGGAAHDVQDLPTNYTLNPNFVSSHKPETLLAVDADVTAPEDTGLASVRGLDDSGLVLPESSHLCIDIRDLQSTTKNITIPLGGTRGPTSIDQGLFDGVWQDHNLLHVISGPTLTWSTKMVSVLEATGERSFAVLFDGSLVEGTLAASGDEILWSDDDVWKKVGQSGDRLDGTWADANQFHVIQGNVLQWSNKDLTHIERVSSETVAMMFNDARVEGTLNADGNSLSWSDGYTWHRAGLDGVWQEGWSFMRHSIEGTVLKAGDGEERSVVILDRTTLHLEVGGEIHKAYLDPLGGKLNWSDGDVWTRVS